MSTKTHACDMDRIHETITRHLGHTRVTPERQAELVAEKEQLLKRGLIILIRADDYEGRERLLNEYSALSRIINENERILEAEAA